MRVSAIAFLTLFTGCAEPMDDLKPDKERRIETGQVNWLRNLDEAKQLAAKTDKPIFTLFQEIPG